MTQNENTPPTPSHPSYPPYLKMANTTAAEWNAKKIALAILSLLLTLVPLAGVDWPVQNE